MSGPARSFDDPAVGAFRGSVRTFLEGALPPGWHDQRDQMTYAELVAVRRAWDRALFAGGFAGLSWPVDVGGRGLGPVEDYVFSEECALLGAPEGFGRVGRLLAGPGIIHHGTKDQRARFLPPMLEGEEIWCQGYSEPDAGSDLTSLRTRAVLDGDEYVIEGQKVWTSFAQYAHWCILLARTGPPGSGSRGLTLLLVPMDQPGIEVRPLQQISGGDEFNEVFFDGARTAADCLLGAPNEGWRVANDILTHERGVGFGALAVGNLTALLDVFEAHCAPAVGQVPLAEAFRDRVTMLQWQMRRTIELMARGEQAAPSATVLKLYWSELTQEVVHAGTLAGCAGHGSFWRQKLLECRASSIASGTSEILRTVIGERVLGLPREPRVR